MSRFTVALLDPTYGRIVLDEVDASTAAAAKTAANAAPPVSGPSPVGLYTAGQVVDQAAVLTVSGKDSSGNAIVSPTSIPAIPAR